MDLALELLEADFLRTEAPCLNSSEVPVNPGHVPGGAETRGLFSPMVLRCLLANREPLGWKLKLQPHGVGLGTGSEGTRRYTSR